MAVIPILPILYYHGKKIRQKVPRLPEAKIPEGISGSGSLANIHVLYLGESTVAGVGVDTHKNGFAGAHAGMLADSLQGTVTWKVYARSGYTAQMLAREILPSITEQSVDLLVIGIGGNDAFKMNSLAKWRLHVRELLTGLKEKFPETPVVFMNMPPIKEFPAFTPLIQTSIGNLVEMLGNELKKVVNEYDLVFYNHQIITIQEWMERLDIQGDSSVFFSDGVHPSRLTYQTWGKDMSRFVLENEEIMVRLRKKDG